MRMVVARVGSAEKMGGRVRMKADVMVMVGSKYFIRRGSECCGGDVKWKLGVGREVFPDEAVD